MININLVPLSTRRKTTAGGAILQLDLPREVVLPVVGGCAGLLIVGHVLLLLAMGFKAAMLATQRVEWQKILPDKTAIEGLSSEMMEIKKKMNSMGSAVSKSKDYSRKLNTISDSLVKGMWLRRLTVDATALTLEGTVFTRSQTDMVTISTFVGNLKKDAVFMEDFSAIEINSVQKEKKGNLDVSNFTIVGKLK